MNIRLFVGAYKKANLAFYNFFVVIMFSVFFYSKVYTK